MVIGIIGAMEVEVSVLKDRMDVARVRMVARMEFVEGTLAGCHVVVVRSGVGKVDAAVCTQVLVSEFGVDAVVNTGVAGSLDNAIDIGDIVVSTDAMYHDVDATVFGYAPGEVPQLGVVAFPADEALRRAAVEACRVADPDVHVFEGRVVSGDVFVSDPATKERLATTFGGRCCEMEGAAVAQTCWLNDVPFVVVRAISDKADGSKKVLYPVFERKAAQHCAGLVCEFVATLGR